MRIGIDARFLTHPQVGGFKTYTENLVLALAEYDRENEYLVYLDRDPRDGPLPRAENFTYRVVDGTRAGIGMPWREQVGIRRRVGYDRLDLIHFPCNTAPVGFRRPYVVTLHDTIQVDTQNPFSLRASPSERKRWAMTAYSRWAILHGTRQARRIITVSNYERILIAQTLGISQERIAVTYQAPGRSFTAASDETRKNWRRQMESTGLPARFLLGVGYEPRKNIPLLIEAFRHLAASEPTLGLVIVAANDRWRSRLEEQATRSGIGTRVRILGRVTSEQLAALYNLALLFVFPSECEGYGLPPLEAMACGAPTVVMDEASLPEVVGNGAALVVGTDPSLWANAIRPLLAEGARQDLIRRGLSRAREFTWRRCAEETVRVYRAAVLDRRL